jgi:hypothetical protein
LCFLAQQLTNHLFLMCLLLAVVAQADTWAAAALAAIDILPTSP